MKSLLRNRWVLLTARIIIGAVFVYAGWAKLKNPQAFADSIASFQLLPRPLVNPMALGLPVFEFAIGTLLMIGWPRRLAALSVVFLTSIFAVALASALARGLQVNCGCFGGLPSSAAKTWASLGRDLLLVLGSIPVYLQETDS